MRAQRRDRLDVRLNPGATAGVGAGEYQHGGSAHTARPAIGDEGEAANFFGIRPAR